MFGETTIFRVKIWNHPIETIESGRFRFQVPGCYKKLPMFDNKQHNLLQNLKFDIHLKIFEMSIAPQGGLH